MPWSQGCRCEVVFGGKNFTLTLEYSVNCGWAGQLSTREFYVSV